jgi:predicted enzyme related to lactoylglutathione lyase
MKIWDFYAKVFGRNIRSIPEMDYHLAETGGTGGINGGIMTPKKGPWPDKLTFYIDVDDSDAYAKEIQSAGGKIVVLKIEVPGVAWMVLFSDPDERVLGAWQKKQLFRPA